MSVIELDGIATRRSGKANSLPKPKQVAKQQQAMSPAAQRLKRLHQLMDLLDHKSKSMLNAMIEAGMNGVQASTMKRKLGGTGALRMATRTILDAAIAVGFSPDEAIERVSNTNGRVKGGCVNGVRRGTTLRTYLGADSVKRAGDEVSAVIAQIRTNKARGLFLAIVDAGDRGMRTVEAARYVGIKTNGAGTGPLIHTIRRAAEQAGVDPDKALVFKDGFLRSSLRHQAPAPAPPVNHKRKKRNQSVLMSMAEAKVMKILDAKPQTVEVLAKKGGMGIVTMEAVAKKLASKGLAKAVPGLGYTKA